MSGTRITFISGWGAGVDAWAPVVRYLGGAGECAHVPWWDCMGKVPDGNALLRTLGKSPARTAHLLAGWSLGGLIALDAAARAPERVAGLVLVAATARMTADRDYSGADPHVVRAMVQHLERDPEATLGEFARLCIAPAEDAVFQEEFVRGAMRIGPERLRAGIEYLLHTDVRATLPGLRLPVTVLHGEDDHVIRLCAGVYLADNIDGARLTRVPRTGHALCRTDPGLVAAEIRRLIHADGR